MVVFWPAAQLKVMTFGTKNLDSQSVEVCHFLQGLNNAKIDVPMDHHFAKPADGVISCMGCCIYLWLSSVVKIQMQDKTERAADSATFGGFRSNASSRSGSSVGEDLQETSGSESATKCSTQMAK